MNRTKRTRVKRTPDGLESSLSVFNRAFEAEERGDLQSAILLYKQASRLGFTSACVNLGNIYDDLLSPPDPGKATYWYKKALARGYDAGAWNLAVHFKMLGKTRWYRYWLDRAVRLGNENAIQEVRANSRD